MMGERSCGTCRDRRILCDRRTPVCTQCAKSNRACKGYDIRLSWPSSRNTRRAMVNPASFLDSSSKSCIAGIHLVNVSIRDIELHFTLAGSKIYRKLLTQWTHENLLKKLERQPILLRSPFPFNVNHMGITDKELIEYFLSTASRCLATFGHDPKEVGVQLMQMALANDSPSTTAVFQSILTLSSVHRDGFQSQAADHKISALRALVSAQKGDITSMEAAQLVAAGMLLCSFEIKNLSCTSGQWITYLVGAKSVIKAFKLNRSSEFSTLLDWVYYHDVLSRFSMMHWNHSLPSISDSPSSSSISKPCNSSMYNSILGLLAEVCEMTNSPRKNANDDLEIYTSLYKILAFRIRNINPSDIMIELFQSAILVYLTRMSVIPPEPARETEQRISSALTSFSQIGACEVQFPLFILGCEAQSDSERLVVLSLISRTEEEPSSRSLYLVKKLIQAIWTQSDLAEAKIKYADNLTGVISCCANLPAFV